jgi:threonine dehydrogenase-like Zn-dependent dehydrogenase
MRALTFQGIETVRVESVPDPAVEQPGDVVVRVEAAGVCGSDLHVYHGRERGLDPGTVLGHELVGEVVAAGREVARFAPGDRVVSPFTTSCGACFYCRRGLTCRCERGQLFGWVEGGAGLHGAQAELVRVPLADSSLAAVPAGLAPAVALLAGDVLATGLFGAEGAGAGPGAAVAVVGCGPVGLAATVAAGELGAATVFAVDAVAERLALAGRLGAVPLDLRRDDPVAALRAATGGRGADGVVEAVGSPAATRLAVDLARPGGAVAAVGVHTEAAFPFSPVEAYDKNLTYRAGRCPARAYLDRALALAARREGDLAALLTHRLPLDDGPRGYRLFAARRDGCVKVILEPVA